MSVHPWKQPARQKLVPMNCAGECSFRILKKIGKKIRPWWSFAVSEFFYEKFFGRRPCGGGIFHCPGGGTHRRGAQLARQALGRVAVPAPRVTRGYAVRRCLRCDRSAVAAILLCRHAVR
jgi:hypothetical protein